MLLVYSTLNGSMRTLFLSRCSQSTVLLSLSSNMLTDLHDGVTHRFGTLAGPLGGAVAASVSFGVWPVVGVCTILVWSVISVLWQDPITAYD